MTLQGWQRHYLDALLRSRPERAEQYETLTFLISVLEEPADGVQELLLHRTIANLGSIDEALDLLTALRQTKWKKYGPRILARIGDPEAVLRNRPKFGEYFRLLRERTGYTTYSLKDWKLIGDGYNFRLKDAPVWASRITTIDDIVEEGTTKKFGINEVAAVLRHFYEADVRVFQLALLTNSSSENDWAAILHRILAAPFIEIGGFSSVSDSMVSSTPKSLWAPHWQITADPRHKVKWYTREMHTERELVGLGSTGAYDRISVLLALSGLLREGIQLSIIEEKLMYGEAFKCPLWDSQSLEPSAVDTSYSDDDISALALGFLEQLPDNNRVSMLRSCLALHFVMDPRSKRDSAAIVTADEGFYQQLSRAAQLVNAQLVEEASAYIAKSPFRYEPAFRFFSAQHYPTESSH